MNPRWSSLLLAALFASTTLAGGLTREQLAQALRENPTVVLDFMREHRRELFDVLNEALAEDEARQKEAAAAAERKEIDDAIAHPKQPKIDAATRIRGNRDARFTIVEYSDFQCPYCARAFQTVEELRGGKYGRDVRFVYRNVPLGNAHPQALPAARYFEAASLQSEEKAWQFHDRLFANQQKLGEEFYLAVARELGLDVERLVADAKSARVQARIDADLAEAAQFGFTGTPGFLVNGVPVRGAYPLAHFEALLERLAASPAAGAP